MQNDGDYFVPFSERGTHQHLVCGPGVARLESVASGKVTQKTIMISQLGDDAFGRFPSVVNRSDHLAEERLLHGSSGNKCQIMGCGVVAWIVQPVWICKMAICRSQFRGP